VSGYARPLSLAVITRLLGIPEELHHDFRHWTEAYLSVDRHTAEQMRAAVSALRQFLQDLVTARRRRAEVTPEERDIGLLDVLVRTRYGQDTLTDEEIVSLLCTVLVAGYETVAAHIANSVVVLLRHPDQLSQLRERPEHIGQAVEELLRFVAISPNGGTLRVATEDVRLGDVSIRPGEAVLPATTAANRDERVFADADALDVFREANPHIAFGYGAHHCLGAGLARLELRVALIHLVSRLPELALAEPLADVRWEVGKIIRGPQELMVRW